ncbi:dNA-directed DNA polymerase [Azospirillum sp. CAG:260]|nr:dNA-directed DNA polymerase [Azospirillum sp. CAG:260]
MNKRVCLIDGSGYIFRAFYALPPLTSPDGIPVNAVYGFTNMFMRLTQKIKCDYSLVLFDAKRQNFRNEIFPDYKGTRKEIPEDLIPQFDIIHQAVKALNLHYLDMEGYEADDLIATYADMALKAGCDVTVISADKDLMQLIRPGVEFYDPMKDKYFTPEDVREKFGVYPDRVVDVQALAGDSTDNIPGVPGIGLKTAAELVNQFGSLEEVLNRAGEIKQNKRRETLLENIDKAKISLQLVTLKPDVPVTHKIEEYACQKPDLPTILEFVSRYGFNSIRPRVEKWVAEQCSDNSENTIFKPVAAVETHYELVQDEAGLKRWADKIRQTGFVAFDTETNGLNPQFDKIVGFSLAVAPGEACYVPLAHAAGGSGSNLDLFSEPQTPAVPQLKFEQVCKILKPLFTSKSILKIGHNIKFDLHFMEQVWGEETLVEPLEDTAVLSYVLNGTEHGHGLDELAKLYLDHKMIAYEEVCGSGKNKITFDRVELDQALNYAAEDADYTLRLYQLFRPRLFAEHQVSVYEDLDRPLINILKEMEDSGIKVNTATLRALSADFELKMRDYEQQIYQLAGEEFNIGSPKQIGDILFGKLGAKGKKTPTGAWQTGADILEDLAAEGNELSARILDWRALSKLKSTYTDALLALLDKNERVHTTYNQINTSTGRLASNNPNLQNIPIRSEEGKKIRECFIARPRCKLIASDYSQVELRLLAVVADVKGLKHSFAENQDIHAATASRVFGVPLDKVTPNQRRHAKAINFGIVYGISQYGLAKQIDVSNEEAKAYIDAYFREMPEIKKYMDDTIQFARKNGYVLTPFGRKCTVNGINDKNKRLAMNAERAAINAPIQGGAADIIKMAMNSVFKALKKGNYQTRMLLQVHDELVFEAPENEVEEVAALIRESMQNVVHYDVPFIAEVGIGDNWAQAH